MSKTISVRWLAAVVAGVVVGVILATSVGAPAVPVAARAASIASCDIEAQIPGQDPVGPRGRIIFYGAKIECNGSVTLDDLVTILQKRSGRRWHVVARADWGSVEVRHHHTFGTYKACRSSGTFRTIGIMTKGLNSEKDVSAEGRITCA